MKLKILLGLAVAAVVLLSVSAEAATAEEGHRHPTDWQFRLPKGDASIGRELFTKYECFKCHAVNGGDFPKPEGDAVGPELSQMGPMHPLEFFAESIVNPNAEVSGGRYKDPKGNSKMPSYNEIMTAQEVIDLSAFLASLRPVGMPKIVEGLGKVVALVPQSHQIVINHGDIRGFMEAMTMGYKVQADSLLRGLKPGDSIRFIIDTEKKAIVKIQKEK